MREEMEFDGGGREEPFERRAAELTMAREELKKLPITSAKEEEENAAGLSKAQQKRLNQSRLDPTLQMVASHPVWKSGLQVSDHISALKASLVRSDLDAHEVEEHWNKLFGYDGEVVANEPQPSTFRRACAAQHGGVCRCTPHFNYIQQPVHQFDVVLQDIKWDSQPVLIHMEYSHRRRWRQDTPIPFRVGNFRLCEQACEGASLDAIISCL